MSMNGTFSLDEIVSLIENERLDVNDLYIKFVDTKDTRFYKYRDGNFWCTETGMPITDYYSLAQLFSYGDVFATYSKREMDTVRLKLKEDDSTDVESRIAMTNVEDKLKDIYIDTYMELSYSQGAMDESELRIIDQELTIYKNILANYFNVNIRSQFKELLDKYYKKEKDDYNKFFATNKEADDKFDSIDIPEEFKTIILQGIDTNPAHKLLLDTAEKVNILLKDKRNN